MIIYSTGLQEALAFGLVARVTPTADTVTVAIEMAQKIGAFSKPIIAMAKEAVNASYEMSLAEVHFSQFSVVRHHLRLCPVVDTGHPI